MAAAMGARACVRAAGVRLPSLLRWLVFACCCTRAVCPKPPLTTSAIAAGAARAASSTGASSTSSSAAVVATVATGAAAAWMLVARAQRPNTVPAHTHVPRSGHVQKTINMPRDAHKPATACESAHACDECDADEDYDANGSDSDDDLDVREGDKQSGAASSSSGKLWSSAQFPEGTAGSKNWDMANLQAAQAWECPCHDRQNCISADRVPMLTLYEYRKEFRTGHARNLRDACRCVCLLPPLHPEHVSVKL